LKVQIYTEPTLEIISLADLKLHLRLDSGAFSDEIDTVQSIAPGNKAIANNYTTHAGNAVEVLGYTAIVNLISGTNGATGTVDCKIQDSDDSTTWTDWTGGAFTQVTTVNDNATQEIPYTGARRYVRTVAKVLLATCDFGTTVTRYTGDQTLDNELNDAIVSGRKEVENITRRQLLTATWDYYLDEWPAKDFIKLPLGNLATVTSVSWKDSDGTETTLTVTTDYLVETNGEQCGKIVLPYGGSWPIGTLYPSNPIKIRFTCGWTAAASVPRELKQAVKFAAQDDFYNGSRHDVLGMLIEKKTASYILWDEF